MLQNYLLVTVRNLWKNFTYSVINIAGLSIGIACTLLIFLWVRDELSFDRFHPKAERLFQVWANGTFDGTVSSFNSVPLPAYQAMKSEHSSIVNAAATDFGGRHLLTAGETKIKKSGFYASEEFMTMFGFGLLQGNPDNVLADPHAIVLTESTARALFGDIDPINRIVRLDNSDELKVTGICKDVPANSSIQFDFLLPWSLYQTRSWVKNKEHDWDKVYVQLYVELDEPSARSRVEQKIADLLSRHGQNEFPSEVFLHPLTRLRLHSDFENGEEAGGMIDYVRMFSIVACLILCIACINFMNLSTARSTQRAREVGIRKSVGSGRTQLVAQFIGESLAISLIAFSTGLLLAMVSLPFYNHLVQKELTIRFNDPVFWISAVVLVLFTGVVAGSYPAFYLSSFQPVKVLKGVVTVGKEAVPVRKIFVTIQFGFAVLLIISTVVIYQQIEFVKNRDLGYQQQNLISIENTGTIRKNYQALKHELMQTGVVSGVTGSNSTVTQIHSRNFLRWPGMPEDRQILFSTIAAEYDYTRTTGIKILQGRDFSEDFRSDTAAILINKAALEIMGVKNPVGQQVELWGTKREVIGVLDNTLMESPYAPVEPLFVVFLPEWVTITSVRITETDDLAGALQKIEAVFRKYNPEHPFEYEFASAAFARKFATINLTGNLANVFAFLAIAITGLGLFGLATFTAELRKKEVGIRKVLGASVFSIVTWMSADFMKIVVTAFLIAAPVSWWAIDSYLQRYPYRIGIPWWAFPLTAMLVLLFAGAIISTQTFRAARSNPVETLRND